MAIHAVGVIQECQKRLCLKSLQAGRCLVSWSLSPDRGVLISYICGGVCAGAEIRNHKRVTPLDFESSASTNSAIPAGWVWKRGGNCNGIRAASKVCLSGLPRHQALTRGQNFK